LHKRIATWEKKGELAMSSFPTKWEKLLGSAHKGDQYLEPKKIGESEKKEKRNFTVTCTHQ